MESTIEKIFFKIRPEQLQDLNQMLYDLKRFSYEITAVTHKFNSFRYSEYASLIADLNQFVNYQLPSEEGYQLRDLMRLRDRYAYIYKKIDMWIENCHTPLSNYFMIATMRLTRYCNECVDGVDYQLIWRRLWFIKSMQISNLKLIVY